MKTYEVEDVAEMLHCERRTIYRYIKEGKLETIKVGRRHLISEDQLNKAFYYDTADRITEQTKEQEENDNLPLTKHDAELVRNYATLALKGASGNKKDYMKELDRLLTECTPSDVVELLKGV